MILIEDSWEARQISLRPLDKEGKNASLNNNIAKTLLFVKTDKEKPNCQQRKEIENVSEFVYLGCLITSLQITIAYIYIYNECLQVAIPS